MHVDVPSIGDMFRVAFLVKNGWVYNEFSEVWTKEGEYRTVEKTRSCGCCVERTPVFRFNTEEAYDHQCEGDS